MDVIRTEELTKQYPRQIGHPHRRSLDSLTLSVGANEVFGYLGRNGAGKTTTIKILCSLLRQTSGSAEVMGHPARSRAARRRIGYLPENPYFYEYLTPRETLDFYGRLHGLSGRQRAEEWTKLAEMLDLHDIANQRVRGFSKGMRQRLGFAVALVGDPQLLILDEPMSGLDPLGRRMVRELILRLRGEGKTVFFSSHVLGDVEQICDRVGILVQGRLVDQGGIATLLRREVRRVEIILDGLSEAEAGVLAAGAESHRTSEAGHHFMMGDLDAANALAERALQNGAKLIEFSPVKERLEDYFMRRQLDSETAA